jgi:H+/Cl- antiporter ClcA
MTGKTKTPVPAWAAIVYGVLSVIGIVVGEIVIKVCFIHSERARSRVRKVSPAAGAIGVPIVVTVGIFLWITSK